MGQNVTLAAWVVWLLQYAPPQVTPTRRQAIQQHQTRPLVTAGTQQTMCMTLLVTPTLQYGMSFLVRPRRLDLSPLADQLFFWMNADCQLQG